jgi:uncharacterized protein
MKTPSGGKSSPMPEPHVDTDVFIRYLTSDDPVKQARAETLFQQVKEGKLKLIAPVTVIADCVFVLSSPRLYNKPPDEVAELLRPILKLPNLVVQQSRTVARALDLFVVHNIGFGDAFIAASMLETGAEIVYSFDRHLERIKGITRREP